MAVKKAVDYVNRDLYFEFFWEQLEIFYFRSKTFCVYAESMKKFLIWFFQILGPEKYVYVLDRNCVQFEPDHPLYIRTCNIVFDHVDVHGNYEDLVSTRHFGALLFYLNREKKIDNILMHWLKNLRIEEASMVSKYIAFCHTSWFKFCSLFYWRLSTCTRWFIQTVEWEWLKNPKIITHRWKSFDNTSRKNRKKIPNFTWLWRLALKL